jgi:D-aminopeptidase
VQTNFGGDLRLPGFLPERPAKPAQAASKTAARSKTAGDPDAPPGQPPLGGSIILVVATDAPLSDRNLTRLARRALGGLARSGAALANQSGDYALAFSTHPEVRRTPARRRHLNSSLELPNDLLSPLFLAAIEASEEAIYNSLCMAETTTGFQGHTAQAIPYITVLSLIKP